jgi:hypothetical protein
MTDHPSLWIPPVLPASEGSTERKYVKVAAAKLCMKRSGTLAFVLRVDDTSTRCDDCDPTFKFVLITEQIADVRYGTLKGEIFY